MNASIVADGRERLNSALAAKMRQCRAEVSREIEARHEAALASAGFWRRWLIRYHIVKEVAAVLRREFPSRHALFIAEEANQPLQPTRLLSLRFRTARARSTARCHSKKTACSLPRAAEL